MSCEPCFSGPSGEFALYDFAPRFQLYQRFFKPSMLVRILRPLSGEPRARVRCRPTYDYGLAETGSWRASNHIEYTGFPTPVRLTTNVPFDLRRGRAPVPARGGSPPRPHLGRAARGGTRGDRRALPRAHARLLAPLGEGDARSARLPARGRPLRARPQAAPVRGHGCAARRDDDEPARASRLRAHLGLPLLLAARRLLHAERLRAARPLGGDGAVPRVPAQHRRGAGGSPPARLPDQRSRRRGGARARAPGRLQRRRTGAGRQPGVRARAERRLRRDGARGQPPLPGHPLRRRDPAADRGRDRELAPRPDRVAPGGAGRGPVGVPRAQPPAQLLGAHALGGLAAGGRGGRGARRRGARRARPVGGDALRRSYWRTGAGTTRSAR